MIEGFSGVAGVWGVGTRLNPTDVDLTVSGTMTGIEEVAFSLRCLTSTHYLSSAMMVR
jgi:hypothetical protein